MELFVYDSKTGTLLFKRKTVTRVKIDPALEYIEVEVVEVQ